MSFFKKIFSVDEGEATGGSDSPVIRQIATKLNHLEPEQRDYIAAFSFILGRVAAADLKILPEELEAMREILTDVGKMDEAKAKLIVDIVKAQTNLQGATEHYLVTREFNEMASQEQKEELMSCLFAVSAADDSISAMEEKVLKQIGSELRLSDGTFNTLRSKYREYREVLRGLPK